MGERLRKHCSTHGQAELLEMIWGKHQQHRVVDEIIAKDLKIYSGESKREKKREEECESRSKPLAINKETCERIRGKTDRHELQ